MSLQQTHQMNTTPGLQDRISAHHGLNGIIPAFDQNIGDQQPNQIARIFLAKEHHCIDPNQGSKNGSPCIFVLHRALRSFETPNRGIVVEGNHQTISLGRRFAQNPQMTGVQKIKTTVGKNPTMTLRLPFLDERQQILIVTKDGSRLGLHGD